MRTARGLLGIVAAAWGLCAWMAAAQADESAMGLSELSFAEFSGQVQVRFPALRQQEADVQAALARRALASASRFPDVAGYASATRSDDPVYVFGSRLKQGVFTQGDFALTRLNDPSSYTNYQGGVRVRLPLFTAFQTIARVRAAERLVDSSESRRSFAEMEARLLATEAFSDGLLWQTMLDEAVAVLQAVREDVRQAEDLKERGVVLGADFYAARALAASLEGMRRDIAARQETARAVANVLRGEPSEEAVRFGGALPSAASLPPAGGASDWIGQAMQRREDLAALRSAIHAQAQEVFRERASALPSVYAVGAVEGNTRDWSVAGESFLLGVEGRMDLFDPARAGRVRLARAELLKLQEAGRALEDEIVRSISEAHAQYAAALDSLPVAEQGARDARESVSLLVPLYEEGRKSIVDLLETRQLSLQAVQRHRQLQASAALGAVRLRFLAGALDEPALQEASAAFRAFRDGVAP